MKYVAAFLLILFGALPNVAAQGVAIGLFADPDCSTCNLSIPQGETGTVYVAVRSGTILWGGAEFRVSGLPDNWIAVSTAVPEANVVLGTPFGSRANIGFPVEQSGDCSVLYTVEISATSAESELILRVVAGDPPSNPIFDYPFLLPGSASPCDFCVYRADGGELLVNSSNYCTVAVDSETWSAIKKLYH
jgi:hypothetical protein